MIHVRFWGVRGSIATGGGATAGVGGNTSCVEVRCSASDASGSQPRSAAAGEKLLIFDAGTGLRALGSDLLKRGAPVEAHLLLSHLHWDHIQGFPFFTPAYVPGNHLTVYGTDPGNDGGGVRSAFAAQMRPPHFPVGLDAMQAQLEFRTVTIGESLSIGAARVRTFSGNHPGGCIVYRVDCEGSSVVYATDTEHSSNGQVDANLVAAAAGADVLIYDAQYTPDEYCSGKRGWGHSTAEEGVRLAREAGVRRLVLFHHDPSHDDSEVARIEASTRALFPNTIAAREGLELAIPPTAPRLAPPRSDRAAA